MLKTSVYPGASPPRDAPSPTANDDPFREGVEIAFKRMFLGLIFAVTLGTVNHLHMQL